MEKLVQDLEMQPWRRAARPSPHEYIAVRFAPQARALMKAIADALNEHGYWMVYETYGTKFRYVDFNGYAYWLSEWEDGAPQVLNRVRSDTRQV